LAKYDIIIYFPPVGVKHFVYSLFDDRF
jgi:hypothetical protein